MVGYQAAIHLAVTSLMLTLAGHADQWNRRAFFSNLTALPTIRLARDPLRTGAGPPEQMYDMATFVNFHLQTCVASSGTSAQTSLITAPPDAGSLR
jgi:hypothetical protein